MKTALVLSVLFVGTFGFQQFPVFNSQRTFNTPARQDCLTQPGEWSPCSASCGFGFWTRQLTIVQQPTGYGRRCPTDLTETEQCNVPCAPPPVDCVVDYGQYGLCSATCGQGVQTRTGRIIRQAQNGGQACPSYSQLTQTIPCQGLPPCAQPVDCEIGYTPYSLCSQPCGGGVQTRSAFIVTEAAYGGAPCPADLSELSDSRQCNTDVPCSESYNCEFVTGDFGSCSASCGSGIQSRRIYIVSQPTQNGLACPTELLETRPCVGPQGPCPVPQDCEIEYPPFGPCSASCGGGIQTTTGRIVRQASNGGASCPNYGQMTITRTCANTPCAQISPRDCSVVPGPTSPCSASCGGGYAVAKNFIKNEAENGGLQCPSITETVTRVPCNNQPCAVPVDCVVQRGYWGACSATCGGGQQTRQVTIVRPAENGGQPCPSSQFEVRPCSTQPCQSAPVTYGQRQLLRSSSGQIASQIQQIAASQRQSQNQQLAAQRILSREQLSRQGQQTRLIQGQQLLQGNARAIGTVNAAPTTTGTRRTFNFNTNSYL